LLLNSGYDERKEVIMRDTVFDLIVVGGGPGGYVAAIRASQLGLRTALVERDHLGGICLNWGCIPTKAMLKSAEVYRQMRRAADYGLSAGSVGFDIRSIVDRSQAVAGRLRQGVKQLLRKNNVMLYEGHGHLHGPARVRVSSNGRHVEDLSAPHVILATGARPQAIPGIEVDGERVWTYRHAVLPKSLPKSLVIIGAGAIGMEFASFYGALGVDVTLVELCDRILPMADADVSGHLARVLDGQGIRIITGARVESVAKGPKEVRVAVSAGDKTMSLTVDRILVAVGVSGNVEQLRLEGTGVRVERSHIVVDEWCCTGEPGVYAIGDVAGGPCLAHKASREGMIVAEKIAGVGSVSPLDKGRIPSCVYGEPQVASFGFTERDATDRGFQVRVGRFPFAGNGKAIALGQEQGFVKTIFDSKTGALLGAHLVGPEVTELLQGLLIADNLETTERELADMIIPHPTLSEAILESAMDACGRAIHS